MSEHMERLPATETENTAADQAHNGAPVSDKKAAPIKWMPLAFDLEGDDRPQSDERGEVF